MRTRAWSAGGWVGLALLVAVLANQAGAAFVHPVHRISVEAAFTGLQSVSISGLPAPADDEHAGAGCPVCEAIPAAWLPASAEHLDLARAELSAGLASPDRPLSLQAIHAPTARAPPLT